MVLEANLILILILFTVLLLFFLFRFLRKKKRLRETDVNALLTYHPHAATFHEHLMRHNHFYKFLSGEDKQQFMRRTIEFMRSKEFVYHDLEKNEKIELLVSAAAIQISFGLENYLLRYFRKIHILRTAYQIGQENKSFAGHVNKEGIFFSWNNLIEGFKNTRDAENVGVHEMAHALAYVNIFASEEVEDPIFTKRFEDFYGVTRNMYPASENGNKGLTDPAFHEFWAESAEKFFERPAKLRLRSPRLYQAISALLNLDLLSANFRRRQATES